MTKSPQELENINKRFKIGLGTIGCGVASTILVYVLAPREEVWEGYYYSKRIQPPFGTILMLTFFIVFIGLGITIFYGAQHPSAKGSKRRIPPPEPRVSQYAPKPLYSAPQQTTSQPPFGVPSSKFSESEFDKPLPKIGSPISSTPTQAVTTGNFCPMCGFGGIEPHMLFCPDCGSKVK